MQPSHGALNKLQRAAALRCPELRALLVLEVPLAPRRTIANSLNSLSIKMLNEFAGVGIHTPVDRATTSQATRRLRNEGTIMLSV